ncbi:hypothetical protein CKO16_22395 [Rhodoblastus acidophilus]|uniref:Uncharacterized protein n=1 Tax=Halochromatium glycolicum TaxID=85075 RepID=A0AAJ0XCK1_9GAMM|nr:hypothetical protein [Halochromatium glycolicum]PPQ34560.1 hypothetical protein CKO16_22395 [Rhodoblastus acidophilus]
MEQGPVGKLYQPTEGITCTAPRRRGRDVVVRFSSSGAGIDPLESTSWLRPDTRQHPLTRPDGLVCSRHPLTDKL